jgi:Zn-dependent protease with chaperone function
VAESIEQFGFELTASALAEQERALTGLRARAGTVLAAASIAGSFFGAKASHGSLDVWGIVGMIAFALSVGSAIWVLLPHAFVFAFRGETLLAESDHRGVSNVAEAYRTAGIWIEPHIEVNRSKIADLSNWLAASCTLLAAEVILWTLSIIG